jgi:hypothetical protein
MVLDLRDWEGAEFYKKLTQSYLQLLFTVHINNPPKEGKSALEDAIALMSPKYLQERARPLAGDPRFSSIVESIDVLNDEKMSNSVRENLQTNRSQLEIFLQGVAGPWLTYDRGGNNISLLETALNGDVVVFSLDSQAYPTLSADIANLIIQDLKTVSSELLKRQNGTVSPPPFHVFIDEFSAIGSDNIVGLINKARASNMYVTIATQALGDLAVKNPALMDQILGIISSFIIHRANTLKDAEVYSGLTGITKVAKVRQSVEQTQNILGGIGTGIGTGNASVEEVEQAKVMPDKIQGLGVGEMFYINTATKRIKNVQCIIEDIADPKKGGTSELMSGQSNKTDSVNPDSLSLKKEESQPALPSLADFTGNSPKIQEPKPTEVVNHQLTAESFNNKEESPRKESFTTMFGKNKTPKEEPKTEKSNKSEDAFAEVKELKKVELNYDLLRTFFNDSSIVDEQEREDIADGVVSAKQPASPAPVSEKKEAPASTPVPAKTSPFAPRASGSLPVARPVLPTRPTRPQPKAPSKSEFDF